MLGRKTYTQAELDNAKSAIAEQVAAYDRLVEAVERAADPRAALSLESFEPLYFNDLVPVLDRCFVHRLRTVTGEDTNPLNEVELLSDSLTNNGGVLRGSDPVELAPAESILGLAIGDRIRVRAAFPRRSSPRSRPGSDPEPADGLHRSPDMPGGEQT
jgi:hypothetical protein